MENTARWFVALAILAIAGCGAEGQGNITDDPDPVVVTTTVPQCPSRLVDHYLCPGRDGRGYCGWLEYGRYDYQTYECWEPSGFVCVTKCPAIGGEQ